MTLPTISIVIPTYKAADHLICCVQSLVRSLDCDHEVQVCLYGDGGGEKSQAAIEKCANMLAKAFVTNATLYNPQNLGNTPALNNAAKMATHDWMLFVNDDMVFPKGWLEAYSPLLKPNRVLSLTCFEPPVFGHKPASCFFARNLGLDPEDFDFEGLDVAAAQHASPSLEEGVNYPFFVERSLFFKVGAADERFVGPYHDPDLFLRFRLEGVELVRTKASPLYHFSGVSMRFADANAALKKLKRRKKSFAWVKLENEARLMFIQKWGAKPKSKFGEVPKTRVTHLFEGKPHGVVRWISFATLFVWEFFRTRWNITRAKALK